MAKKQTVKAAVSRESYAIEKILDSRRTDDGQLEYLIKWKDSPESDNSWQLVGDLFSKKKNSPEIMCDASVVSICLLAQSCKNPFCTQLFKFKIAFSFLCLEWCEPCTATEKTKGRNIIKEARTKAQSKWWNSSGISRTSTIAACVSNWCTGSFNTDRRWRTGAKSRQPTAKKWRKPWSGSCSKVTQA